jgi:hypothetical protein
MALFGETEENLLGGGLGDGTLEVGSDIDGAKGTVESLHVGENAVLGWKKG